MPIVITPGEPAGIGPEIVLQLLDSEAGRPFLQDTVVIADAELMATRAELLGIELKHTVSDNFAQALDRLDTDHLSILHQPLATPSVCGRLETANARYVLDCLDTAIALCCRDDKTPGAGALVTGPVHKGIINEAGIVFSGHTEYLAAPSDSRPVMMLATETLRVVLATTHLPLRDVADSIDQETLVNKITITHDFLKQRYQIDKPRILVCGLNPHAGEDGHLGMEEIDIIMPALEHLRAAGIDVIGPLPADTAFTSSNLEQADAFFAMYHDQGLPVLKYSGFGKAINVTMGLPFIRTSVDHGTALELAGTGTASTDSLHAAILNARQLA